MSSAGYAGAVLVRGAARHGARFSDHRRPRPGALHQPKPAPSEADSQSSRRRIDVVSSTFSRRRLRGVARSVRRVEVIDSGTGSRRAVSTHRRRLDARTPRPANAQSPRRSPPIKARRAATSTCWSSTRTTSRPAPSSKCGRQPRRSCGAGSRPRTAWRCTACPGPARRCPSHVS